MCTTRPEGSHVKCCGRSTPRWFVCYLVIVKVMAILTVIMSFVTYYLIVTEDVTWYDMPTDYRVVTKQTWTLPNKFCKGHTLESITDADGGDTSSNPNFDIYFTKEHPSHYTRRAHRVRGKSWLKPGDYKHHVFNFHNGTSVSLHMCNQPKNPSPRDPRSLSAFNGKGTAIWVCLVKDKFHLNGVRTLIKDDACLYQYKDVCYSCTPIDHRNCTNRKKVFNHLINVSSDHYVIYYYDAKPWQQTQNLHLDFSLYREDYLLQNAADQNITKYNMNVSVEGMFPVVHFNHNYSDSDNDYLCNIRLDMRCILNIDMYLIVFMCPLLAAILVLGLAMYCCYGKQGLRYRLTPTGSIPYHSISEEVRSRYAYGSTEVH